MSSTPKPKWVIKAKYHGRWHTSAPTSETVARLMVRKHGKEGTQWMLEKWICEHRERG